MKKYDIMDNEKFKKKNKAQKKEIVLSTLAAFTFLETSVATLAGGIYLCANSEPLAGSIFLGSSVLTSVATMFCSNYADYVESKNNDMVRKQMSNLNEQYLDAKYTSMILR